MNVSAVFQLTRLMRGVTLVVGGSGSGKTFQLTRLMRGVTIEDIAEVVGIKISTHTPHARRDEKADVDFPDVEISTHTPHARRDLLKILTEL